MPKIKEFSDMNITEQLSIFLMILVTFSTFSLDKAMLLGFLTYILGNLYNGKIKEVSPYLIASTLIILVSVVLSFIYG